MRVLSKSPARAGTSYTTAGCADHTEFISEKEEFKLGECLREWAATHNWHEPDIITNRLKLRRAFAKPIAAAAAEFTAVGKSDLAAQIKADFALLQDSIRTLDRLCVKRIDEDDELVMLEHTKARLRRMIRNLADLLDSGQETDVKNQQSGRKIIGLPPAGGDGQWITMTEAADLVAKHPATIGRWVQNGKVRDNGKKGRQRRVAKTDILLIKQAAEETDLQADLRELQQDARRIK